MNKRDNIGARQTRMTSTEFTVREEENSPIIEGYFAVFNSNYDIAPGMSESIAPGAFSEALGGDIRALVNHDTTLVLGRNTKNTLELREDSHGLWGQVRINPNDTEAMNLYSRVKRGDVDGCSIGFDIAEEETEFLENGDVHWTIKKVLPLYEVSAVTFPAYQETNVSARSAQKEEIEKRKNEAWKERMKERVKHGIKSIDETPGDGQPE